MDRVQLGGSAADEESFAVPLEPKTDALEAAGYYLQEATARDETVLVDRASGQMRFRDNVTGPIVLADLLSGGTAFDVDTILIDDITGDTLTDGSNVLVNS